MKSNLKFLTLFMLSLFTLSLFVTPPVPHELVKSESNEITMRDNEPITLQALTDYPDNYTHVSWDQGTRSDTFNETFSWNEWMFGPSITWSIRNATTSNLIKIIDSIGIDGWANYILKIPKDALAGSFPFAIAFIGSYMEVAAQQGPVMSTEGIEFLAVYIVPEDKWHIYSSKNSTISQGPPAETPMGLPPDWVPEDMFGPPTDPFLEINTAGSGYVVGPENIWTQFQLMFNSTATTGVYGFRAMAMDMHLQPIAQSIDNEDSVRVVGMTFDDILFGATGGYFSWTRVDDDGNLLYSATRGQDFNMTAGIKSPNPDNVTVLIDLPDKIEMERLIDGPYPETVQYTGGWEYDSSSATYIWNASLSVNQTIMRHGLHLEKEIVFFDAGIEYQYFNPELGGWEWGWSWAKQAVIYWFGNNTFDIRLAFGFPEFVWIDDGFGGYWEQYEVYDFMPFPQDGSIPIPYILNTSTSSYALIGNRHVVNFRGHISEEVQPTGGSADVTSMPGMPLRIEQEVWSTTGFRLAPEAHLPTSSPQDRAEYESLRQLSIETPIAVVQLLRKGQPYDPSWMFVIDKQETFTVKSRLQGGAAYADDIDGIAFQLTSFQHDWGFEAGYDWSQESTVEVLVLLAPDGSTETTVYNLTRRTSWEYGGHWEWQYVELFVGSGIWEWEEVWIENWFWKEQVWDFTINDWTDKFIPMYVNETIMPVNYIDVGNVTYTILGDDLRVLFDVTPTLEMPNLEWDWDYLYGNLTWVTDYEGGWGEHMIMGWVLEPVYSYMNGTKVYAETPKNGYAMRNNDTSQVYATKTNPYIELDGNIEYVKKITIQEGALSQDRVLFEEWNETAYDPNTGEYSGFWEYSYELVNGTKIPVKGGHIATVYNVSLPGGQWFLSFQNFERYPFWLPPGMAFMVAMNGTFIFRWDFEWAAAVKIVVIHKPGTQVGLVSFANGTIPILMATEPHWVGDHWIFYKNGTWEEVHVWGLFNPFYGNTFWGFFDGPDVYFFYEDIWPYRLFEVTHLGQPYYVVDMDMKFFAYTDITGVKQQLPYPNPTPEHRPFDIFDLNYRTPVDPTVFINGEWYRAEFQFMATDDILGYDYPFFTANVSSTTYNLTLHGYGPTPWNPSPMNSPWTSVANGSITIPELFHNGWSVAYGHRDLQSWEFVIEGWIDLVSGFYAGFTASQIFDMEGPFQVATDIYGHKYNVTWQYRTMFYNVTMSNGTFFYSSRPWVEEYAVWNATTNNYDILSYYMYDINGSQVNWTEWMDFTVEVITTPFNSTSFPEQYFFEGIWRNITQVEMYSWDITGQTWFPYTEYPVNLDIYRALLNQSGGPDLEIIDLMDESGLDGRKYNFPSFNFTVNQSDWYNLTGHLEPISKAITVWGYGKRFDYVPLPVTIFKDQWRIVTGAPQFGMWDVKSWKIDQATGALDLDGDPSTTADQYFVKKSFEAFDYYNVTEQYLSVSILWEPNGDFVGDEFYIESYTGMHTVNWTTDWSDNFYWYNAETGQVVNSTEWATINATIFDQNGLPRPGYWDIAWMAENFTFADLKQQAIDEGWDWAMEDSQEWSWIWWELFEHYGTEFVNGSDTEYVSVDVWYEYAGMFAWNDTNSDDVMDVDTTNYDTSELTHYWIPASVDAVSFTTPNASSSGDEFWAVNASVPFGVSFENISGDVFPFGDYSYWDWYQGQYYGSDFSSFDERPTQANTTKFDIGVKFTGNMTGSGNNQGEVKFNLTVGDWDVDSPGGRDVLEGRSLGVAFFSHVAMTDENGTLLTTQYEDENGQQLNNTQTASSSTYNITMGAADVASMNLGGQPYIWSKQPSANYTTVDSQTVPYGAFQAAYTSEGGGSATSFEVLSGHFYTLINFKWWDGYEVTVDPVFVGYSSSQGVTDGIKPALDSASTEVRFVNDKEQLHFTATASDTGGSGVADVRIVDDDGIELNTSLTYSGDTSEWVGYVELAGPFPKDFNYIIAVIDYAGNENSTSVTTHTFWNDPDAPEISNLGLTSIGITFVTISATVQDVGASDLDTVYLYVVNTETYYPMTYNASTLKFEITIARASGQEYDMEYRIVAYDNAGNIKQTTTLTYHFEDGIAPVITDFVGSGQDINTTSETLFIEAAVSDNGGSGLSSVQLTYSISGSPTTVEMVYNPLTLKYEYTVPNQAPGTWVSYYVTATDGDGNVATSSVQNYQFYTEADTPPEVSSIGINPTQPSSSDDVTVSAVVNDDGTIQNATLYYRVDSGVYIPLSMTFSGGFYTAVIPAQINGSYVEYYVLAYDDIDQPSQQVSGSYTVMDVDTTNPQISGVGIDILSPTMSDSVTVTATVTDDVAINNVTLYYRVDSSSWIAVVMSRSGNVFSGIIPAQPTGSTVEYYIRAYDTSGNYVDSSTQSYTVSDATTTTTTTTIPTTTTEVPPPVGGETLNSILGIFGGMLVLVVILVILRRRPTGEI